MQYIILIRLMVGIVFFSEGIQKFLFPTLRGAGRFEGLGLPQPEIFGIIIGSLEIICGLLIIVGLRTRFAAIPLIFIMLGAFALTKTAIFQADGFWAVMHASRTDWAMLLGSIYLALNGSGDFAFDNLPIFKTYKRSKRPSLKFK